MLQMALIDIPSTSTEVVYYATDYCNIKIGRSISPRRRGGELKAQMLYTTPGGDFEERRHHKMWAKYRIGRSEWFRPSDELLLWLVLQLVSEGRTWELAMLRQLIAEIKGLAAAA